MSKLKDQLKLILPKLSDEANRNQDKEVKFGHAPGLVEI